MKKKKILISVFCLLFFTSCTTAQLGEFTQSFFGEKLINLTEKEKFERKMREYKLEAVLHTTKGDINVLLYPDAAPYNVAHFVYLAVNNYYDGLTFYRIIPSVLVQTGDKSGEGKSYGGVFIKDEYVDWLDFKSPGMLAMAKINDTNDTNGSQFFITLTDTHNLDNKYTIIGELSARDDLSKARLLRKEDKITGITIKGNNVSDFLNNFKDEFSNWEKYKEEK